MRAPWLGRYFGPCAIQKCMMQSQIIRERKQKERDMRAEAEKLVADINESFALLRRHL